MDDEDEAVVGITDYAQNALGDVVYVELPNIGTDVVAEDEIAVVESVKAASDIYAPIAGEIVRVNETLDEQPELLNADPYGEGWIFVIKATNPNEIESLLDSAQYDEQCESEEES